MKFEQKALIIGGLAGALIGLAAAILYVKANQERIAAVEGGEADSMGKIAPGEALSLGLAVVSLLRQIVGMGQSS
jgi:hypothetical protein